LSTEILPFFVSPLLYLPRLELINCLVRFTALSRTLENAFQREGIPIRLLGGHRFFERLEVSILVCLITLLQTEALYKIKELLAYLQLIDNPEYDSAFLRAVNVPARGIGEKVSVCWRSSS